MFSEAKLLGVIDIMIESRMEKVGVERTVLSERRRSMVTDVSRTYCLWRYGIVNAPSRSP